MLAKANVQDWVCTRPRFDLLRLREWFNQLDSGRTGSVTRSEWIRFMHTNQELCKLMRGESARESVLLGKDAHREAEALQLRKMFKVWEKIDLDKNGTLEWDEFVEFFRLNGFLLEYMEKDNPKDRMAEVLKDMHEGIVNVADVKDFDFLQRRHLESTRRHDFANIDVMKEDLRLRMPIDKVTEAHRDCVLPSEAPTRCPSPSITTARHSETSIRFPSPMIARPS